MRPLTIELEGFASFRDRTTVDLVGVDIAAFTGPTGSGKTSLLDAIVFALYGIVPRYGDRRLVAPAISEGRNEGKVRLTFEVDAHRYTATRVVARTDAGATTREARLEEVDGDGGSLRVLAGTAAEVSDTVQDLLGLSFEHFCTCVLLPQGQFQRFLHAKPKERNDLLVELLDLSIYRRVGERARSRAQAASAAADAAEARLDGDLAGATPEARTEARARIAALTDLEAEVARDAERLERIREEGLAASQARDQAQADLGALTSLAVPADVTELATTLRAATARQADAQGALARAEAALARAEADLAALPDRDALLSLERELEARTQVAEEAAAATGRTTAAEHAMARTTADLAAAETAEDEARAALDAARRNELVQTLLADVAAGDPCPICDRPLDHVPDHGDAHATDAATANLTAAGERRRDAAVAHADAGSELAAAREQLRAVEERRTQVSTRLAAALQAVDLPDDTDRIRAVRTEVDEARVVLTDAQATERAARAASREVAAELALLDARRREAWDAYEAARTAVQRLEPPPRRSDDDPAAAFATLVAWAEDRIPTLREIAAVAERTRSEVATRWQAQRDRTVARCRDAGIAPSDTTSGAAILGAVSQAVGAERARLQELERRIEEAGILRTQVEAQRRESALATELGQHLSARSKRFERWLLGRALVTLVRAASEGLRDLTGGAYSLSLVDGGETFSVVDHRNADAPRLARTLSGGETFLASLALALALGDEVAEMAAQGAARLESLFIDEGFGTLDADTLDAVATAIEALGEQGRMVILISHVPELAERLPVRFDVRKVGNASSVTRHDGEAA